MDGTITTMEAQERLNYDRPAIPVPDFIERELARMDELETAPERPSVIQEELDQNYERRQAPAVT